MKNVGHKAVLLSIDFDCTKYNTWKSYCSRKTWMCINYDIIIVGGSSLKKEKNPKESILSSVALWFSVVYRIQKIL